MPPQPARGFEGRVLLGVLLGFLGQLLRRLALDRAQILFRGLFRHLRFGIDERRRGARGALGCGPGGRKARYRRGRRTAEHAVRDAVGLAFVGVVGRPDLELALERRKAGRCLRRNAGPARGRMRSGAGRLRR
jgi:hypothetical protein